MKKILLWEPPLKEYDHITQGVKTKEFEERFAEFVGADFAVACTSGTTALLISLKTARIKPNEEVLIPDLTAPATMNAVVLAGARPRFLDIERENLLVNHHEFRDMNADARIAVHLNGRVIEAVGALTIEDACHALGSQGVGWGELTCYSFSPTKTIHTGQGGIVTTNDRYQYEKLLKIRQEEGNFKFTDLQAKIALEYMEQLPTILSKKKSVYQVYRHHLQEIRGVQLIETNVAMMWRSLGQIHPPIVAPLRSSPSFTAKFQSTCRTASIAFNRSSSESERFIKRRKAVTISLSTR